MAYNESGQTTNCGKPYTHAEHEFNGDDYCDGMIWMPL